MDKESDGRKDRHHRTIKDSVWRRAYNMTICKKRVFTAFYVNFSMCHSQNLGIVYQSPCTIARLTYRHRYQSFYIWCTRYLHCCLHSDISEVRIWKCKYMYIRISKPWLMTYYLTLTFDTDIPIQFNSIDLFPDLDLWPITWPWLMTYYLTLTYDLLLDLSNRGKWSYWTTNKQPFNSFAANVADWRCHSRLPTSPIGDLDPSPNLPEVPCFTDIM